MRFILAIILISAVGCASSTAPYTEACKLGVWTWRDSTGHIYRVDTAGYVKTFYCHVPGSIR